MLFVVRKSDLCTLGSKEKTEGKSKKKKGKRKAANEEDDTIPAAAQQVSESLQFKTNISLIKGQSIS